MQAEFPWVRKILRNTEAQVCEITIGISREWPWTTNIHLLQNELRIGQRRDLRRNLLRRIPAMPRCLNLRIASFGLREKICELHGLTRWRCLLCPSDCGRRQKQKTCKNQWVSELHGLSFPCPWPMAVQCTEFSAESFANPPHKKRNARAPREMIRTNLNQKCAEKGLKPGR